MGPVGALAGAVAVAVLPRVLLSLIDMYTHDAPKARSRKANADADFQRYDAVAHLAWLRRQDVFTGLLALLRADAIDPHRSGRPLREYPIDAIPPGVSPKRWYGTIRNRVERVLPPAFGAAVALLVRDPHVSLEIAPGRALTPERGARLRADCSRLLGAPYRYPARERRALDAARKRIQRALEAIDPTSPVRAWLPCGGSGALRIGSAVNVSATAFGAGSPMAVASAAGHPVLGHVVALERERVLIDPLRVPERFSFHRAGGERGAAPAPSGGTREAAPTLWPQRSLRCLVSGSRQSRDVNV